MFYFKSKKQVEGEAFAGLIVFLIRFMIGCTIYSPFILAFVFIVYLTQQKITFHILVSIILGLISTAILFFITGLVYGAQQEFKSNSNYIWVFFLLLNLVLISGLPFLIGMSVSLDIIGQTASVTEKVLVGTFGGGILALPAYFCVTKKFKRNVL